MTPVISSELTLAPQAPYAVDEERGSLGMLLLILTEASLFLILFVSYWYLSQGDLKWRNQEPPKLPMALVMLAILLASSAALYWGERQLKQGGTRHARLAGWVTVAAGLGFLALQAGEYRERLKTLTPQTNAYGSIFYTITGIHGLHVAIGLLFVIYALIMPNLTPDCPPHRPLHNAALYWHFIDIVWIVIVGLMYVVPNLR